MTKYNKFLNKHYHHIKSNYNFGKMPKDEFLMPGKI